MKLKNAVPNFIPEYGTTKTVLLTKAERKQIGREILADYVAKILTHSSTGSIVKSFGAYYSYVTADPTFVLKLIVSSPGHKAYTTHFSDFNDFTKHLYDIHNECELRRIAKVAAMRLANRRSVKGNKKYGQ